jgi:hypothetical protein
LFPFSIWLAATTNATFIRSKVRGDGQIVMMFRQLSQIWRELALQYFLVDCFGGSQFGGDKQTIFMDSRLSEIWRELAPQYFPADCFGINFFQTEEFFWCSF